MKLEDRIIEKILEILLPLSPDKRYALIYVTIVALFVIVIIISVLLMLWLN
jgi:hypothetical protein